jgi:hypothetical protein|tara:strand:- start:39 stop:236 length:198 start_codon:yes stop_codon:yes gene_type:complete
MEKYKLYLGDLVYSSEKKVYGVVTDVNKFSNKCQITWVGEQKRPRTNHTRWVDPEVSNFKKVSDD